MIGQTISHYRILDKIGEGGMGVVYKAEDIALNRPVAIKILPPELLSEPSRKERFIQEARAASAINHPNIAHVHELGEHEGIHFIVMEYIEGKTLRHLAMHKKLKLKKLVEIMIQVTDALTKAHKKGIVHRDLKPENIMINEDGLVKVLDFGLAKLIEKTVSEDQLSKASTKPITESGVGTVIGTPFYMSPEQAKGEPIDHRSDIFSLSVVMYEMASGIRPFQGESNVEVLSSILKDEPKPISEINEKVPYQLQHIIHKALAKRRDDRYQTIKDMWVDLREVKRDLETGSAPGISDVKPVPRVSVFRKRWVWAIAGIVGLSVILAAVYFLFLGKFSTGISKKPSVAVLWFENISGDKGEEYFSEGITEELITELWKIGGLRVNTRDDIRPYKSKQISAKELGQQLGFNYVLTGTIQKMTDKVRVTPRLIDAATGSLIWTSRYDDVFKNIFELQDTIAFQIAKQLQVQLSKEEEQQVAAIPTESKEAYDHYLKGRHHYYRTTFRDNELAVKEFQDALQMDPDYPLALAGLADAYVQRYKERYDYDEIWLDEAEKLIEKAMKLDPNLGEAYESEAEVLLEEENLLGALEAAEKARNLQPKLDEPYLRLGEIYLERGERRKALEMFEKALSIRSSVEALCSRGKIYQTRGDLDKAEESYRKAMELNPNHERPYIALGNLYYRERHKTQEAEKFYRQAIQVRPDRREGYEGLMDILFSMGKNQEAEEIVRSFAEKFPYHWDAYELLYDYLAWWKGDYIAAMEVIEEAAKQNLEKIWPQLILAYSYASGMDKKPEPEKALKALERALSLRPKSSRVLEWAGAIHTELGNTEKALMYLNQALEINPGKSGVLFSIVTLFCMQADYEKAVEYAMKAIEQAPGRFDWGIYTRLDNALVELGKPEEFLSIIEKAAQEYGQDNPYFLMELCRQQRLAGRLKDALSTCSKALSLKEEDDNILLEYGVTHFISGNYDAALQSFRKGKRWYAFGSLVIAVLKSRGEFAQIEEYLKKIRTPSPDETSGFEFWSWLALPYYMDIRRFDDALNVANEALKSDEVMWVEDLKITVAALHRARGDMDQAERLLKEIADIGPANYKSYASQELAIIKAVKGDFVTANEFAKRAYSERIPTEKKEPVLELQARLHYAQGNEKEALKLIRETKGFRGQPRSTDVILLYRRAQFEIVDKSPNAHQYLNKALLRGTRLVRGETWYSAANGVVASFHALILARSGKSQEARSEIKRAMQLEPERADIAYYAACVFSLLGDTEKALEWLQTAVDRGYQELWWAQVDPDLDPLRDNPRFKKIMKDWDTGIRALFD